MRRSARSQSLPQEEAAILVALSLNTADLIPLKRRCSSLFHQGWTLSAIGAPLNRQRSTIRSWVTAYPPTPNQLSHPDTPQPEDRSYTPKKPPSPGISEINHNRIAYLAPLARKYRSKLPRNHICTQANLELTELAQSLHARNVTIQELANAASVTYRAMYKRVHNNVSN